MTKDLKININLVDKILSTYKVGKLFEMHTHLKRYQRTCCTSYVRIVTYCAFTFDEARVSIQINCINCKRRMLDYSSANLDQVIPYLDSIYHKFTGKIIVI